MSYFTKYQLKNNIKENLAGKQLVSNTAIRNALNKSLNKHYISEHEATEKLADDYKHLSDVSIKLKLNKDFGSNTLLKKKILGYLSAPIKTGPTKEQLLRQENLKQANIRITKLSRAREESEDGEQTNRGFIGGMMNNKNQDSTVRPSSGFASSPGSSAGPKSPSSLNSMPSSSPGFANNSGNFGPRRGL